MCSFSPLRLIYCLYAGTRNLDRAAGFWLGTVKTTVVNPAGETVKITCDVGMLISGNHTPYILYPTPYTLRPTPYTLHPTPYTLHPTP